MTRAPGEASGEVGTCLDPNNPSNLLATECEHPPDYWPAPEQEREG